MKLYTEEQVRNALKDAMLRGMRKPSKYESIVELMINDLNPIELPSDEEIEEEAERLYPLTEEVSIDLRNHLRKKGFIDGMEWMRNKIQGGNK